MRESVELSKERFHGVALLRELLDLLSVISIIREVDFARFVDVSDGEQGIYSVHLLSA